jgi:ketosteroid isomerase-like protein
MTREDFEDYFASFQRGDFDGFSKYYADDVTLTLAGGLKVLEGKKAIIDFYRHVLSRIREKLEITWMLMTEDGIAVEIKTEFIALEDWPDFMVRPMRKGESARTISFAHYTIKNGKFSDIRACRYGMW